MPSARRTRATRREYSAADVKMLLDGRWWGFTSFGPDTPDMTPRDKEARSEAARRAWFELWQDLLPLFIDVNPGCRPWAWWQWDAPEPIGDGETEYDYLKRHGLLTPEETETLNGQPRERESITFAAIRDWGWQTMVNPWQQP
jgi:hypothetical protein